MEDSADERCAMLEAALMVRLMCMSTFCVLTN
jgi:hypothetical protein